MVSKWTWSVLFAATTIMAVIDPVQARSHATGSGEPVDVTVWRDGQTLTLRPAPEEYR